MTAFVTGSRVFGIPGTLPEKISDVDLVILCTQYDINILMGPCNEICEFGQSPEYKGKGWSLKFGNLNILAIQDVETFNKWRECTQFCNYIMVKRHQKLTREESKKIFKLYIEENWPLERIEDELKLRIVGYIKHEAK